MKLICFGGMVGDIAISLHSRTDLQPALFHKYLGLSSNIMSRSKSQQNGNCLTSLCSKTNTKTLQQINMHTKLGRTIWTHKKISMSPPYMNSYVMTTSGVEKFFFVGVANGPVSGFSL